MAIPLLSPQSYEIAVKAANAAGVDARYPLTFFLALGRDMERVTVAGLIDVDIVYL